MRFLPFIIFALLSIIFLYGLMTSDAPEPVNKIAKNIYRNAPPLQINKLKESDSPKINELNDKPILLNFFASWCTPCLAEHPLMLKLSKEQNLIIYGIAWKDTPDNVTNWLGKHGNPYNYIAIDDSSHTAISYGLTGVPESYLIKNGKIIFHYAGPLTNDIITKDMLPLLEDK